MTAAISKFLPITSSIFFFFCFPIDNRETIVTLVEQQHLEILEPGKPQNCDSYHPQLAPVVTILEHEKNQHSGYPRIGRMEPKLESFAEQIMAGG